MNAHEQTFDLPDAQATKNLGVLIGKQASKRLVLALVGNLGAGKTTLVQGIGQGLGVAEVINSPTFTTLNEYHSGRLPLFHIDLYRLGEQPGDKLSGGISVVVTELAELAEASGLVVIEWAEFLGDELPPEHLLIKLDYAESASGPADSENGGRSARISASGDAASLLLSQIKDFLISS